MQKGVITINTKQIIITKYYEYHIKPTTIAKQLNIHPSYITKIIKSDTRYAQEKQNRLNTSKEHRKQYKSNWIKNKRAYNKELDEFVKLQHIQATKELSYDFYK